MEESSMRLMGIAALVLVLALGPVNAAPRALQTVIVTPVTISAPQAAPALTRAERVAHLMEEAKLSQARLLADLAPLTAGPEAGVTEVHPLWIVNRVVVTATPEVIAALAKRSDVTNVRDAKRVELVAPTGSTPEPAGWFGKHTYGLKKLNVPEAWAKHGVDGSGVVVGHIDTGVYSIHPDLKGKILKFRDFFGAEHPTGFDGQGHGTHTAGTIVGGNSGGKHIGVAPGAKLIVARIFNNSGATTDAIVLRAMNWVADPDNDPATPDAPRLVSNSWGGSNGDDDSTGGELWDAVQHWLDLGILPVFAAGNAGPKPRTMGVPGGYPHALAVGSTTWMNKASKFSSRGPIKWAGEDITKPDVAAPGSGVSSAKDKGGYWTLDGTSMACPHVAGVAALIFQANPDLNPTQVAEILRSTAKDMGDAGFDNTFGKGLIDAERAVEKAKALRTFTAGE
jgi:subtilisin family serine protease